MGSVSLTYWDGQTPEGVKEVVQMETTIGTSAVGIQVECLCGLV